MVSLGCPTSPTCSIGRSTYNEDGVPDGTGGHIRRYAGDVVGWASGNLGSSGQRTGLMSLRGQVYDGGAGGHILRCVGEVGCVGGKLSLIGVHIVRCAGEVGLAGGKSSLRGKQMLRGAVEVGLAGGKPSRRGAHILKGTGEVS